MLVELPRKVADIFCPVFGMWHTDACMLLGIQSTNWEESLQKTGKPISNKGNGNSYLFCVRQSSASTADMLMLRPLYMAAAEK